MERRKGLLILGVVLAHLLLLMVPVMPAANILSISPTSGSPGTAVRLTGEIDTEGGYYQIIGFGRVLKEDRCLSDNKTVDTLFTVPDYLFGSHTISLKDKATGASSSTTFSIMTHYIVSAPRQQEGLNTAITVSLRGGINNTSYQFNITVTDPRSRKSAKLVTAPPTVNGSSSVSVLYYGDFPAGATTNFNGTYSIVLDEKYPGLITSVATGTFAIGLTDITLYKRFEVVNIRGSGYNATETVTVDVEFSGASIGGYPKNLTATTDGVVTDPWAIPRNASIGTYTVSLMGRCVVCNATRRTVKVPPDVQDFTVVGVGALNVTVVDQPAPSYQRTLTAIVNFTVQYPDSSYFKPVDLGAVVVKVYYNTTLVKSISLGAADFDSATNKWMVKWKIPKDALLGANYSFTVLANDVVDKAGNIGPVTAVSSTKFKVEYAFLAVAITDQWTLGRQYSRTATVTMKFTAKFPDLTYYTPTDLGTITVGVYKGDASITNMTLTAANFDPATNNWTTSWVIPWNAMLGSDYKFRIRGNEVIDRFGNKGPTTALDSNRFEVVVVILSLSAIYTDSSTYVRGSYVTVYFTAAYLDGSPVITGSAAIILTKPGGSAVSLTAYYVAARNRFVAKYLIAESDPLGTWTARLGAQGLRDGADNAGPATDRTAAFSVALPPAVVAAHVRIQPRTLNLRSNGKWITVHIRLPDSYSASAIHLSTVQINGIAVDVDAPKEVKDHELIVKLDRATVAELIRRVVGNTTQKFSGVTLTITGEVAGRAFQGSDTIKVKI